MYIYTPVTAIIETRSPRKKDNRMSSGNNNAKKKQEEKHLKLLRELLTLPANKNCFDCNQRGPTYVNTTIGSFVCISCSGKLRGLTPPHRVKSISMASFTPEEIDFLKSRGNEYCKQVWMALYSDDVEAETKDDQKFRDHLTAKYERKRWYAESGFRNHLATPKMNGTSSNMTGTSPKMIQHQSPAKTSTVAPQQQATKCSDLLTDLDFFAPPAVSTAGAPRKDFSVPQSTSQPSFANFQNADFFVATFPPSVVSVNPAPSQAGAQFNSGQPVQSSKSIASPPKEPPPEDRYSALKDLDALFTTQTEPVPAAPANWSTNAWSSTPNVFPSETHFGTPPHSAWNGASVTSSPTPPVTSQPVFSSNPFLTATIQPTSQAVNFGQPVLPWANFSSSPVNSQFNGNNGLGNGIGITPLTTSQSLNFSPKAWNSSSSSHNPFMENSFTKGRSHNPFL